MPFDARDIARLRDVTTRSISPENFDGTKGGGGRATQGTGANAARDLGVGWKISPSVIIDAGSTFPLATIEVPGHDHARLAYDRSCTVAELGAPGVLGRRSPTSCRGPARRLLRQRLGPVRSGQFDHDRRQPAWGLQLLLADAFPAWGPAHGREPRR